MEPSRFDALTRSLNAHGRTRRTLLGAVAALLAGSRFPADDAAARRRKRKCRGGLVKCASGCVDLASDPNNCGGCGIVCAAGESCEAGTCVPEVLPDRCTDLAVCNAPYVACGTTAGGAGDCSCERAIEGNRVCINFLDACAGLVACTSTDGPEATSCRNSVGFHFFCQQAKTDGQGRPCGCGQVCVPECDNPNFP